MCMVSCRLSPTSPGTSRSLSVPEAPTSRVPVTFGARSRSMPITAASIAAQKLDEYLQRAVASGEGTQQINLGHSSNRGASLLSHISQAGGTSIPYSREAVTIKPSDVRRAGGKVTADRGLITVKEDDKASNGVTGAKRMKLDDTVLSKLRQLEQQQTSEWSGLRKKGGKSFGPSGSSKPPMIISTADTSIFQRDVKLEKESKSQLSVASASTDKRVNSSLSEVDKGRGSNSLLIKAHENAMRSRLFQERARLHQDSCSGGTVNSLEQSTASSDTLLASANISQRMASLKSSTASNKRQNPEQFVFSVSDKVKGSLLNPPMLRQDGSSPFVPASQLSSGSDQISDTTRQVLRSQSRRTVPAIQQQAPPESGQETDAQVIPVNFGLSDDGNSTSSHLPYENIFNPDNPFSHPSVGLSEMFEDVGFDYVSNYLLPDANFNRVNLSPTRTNRSNNQGRILLGNSSSSSLNLVTDSSSGNSTPRFDMGGDYKSRGAARSRMPHGRISCYSTSVATRLRQCASHTVTSAGSDDGRETNSSIGSDSEPVSLSKIMSAASVTRTPSENDESGKTKSSFMKRLYTQLRADDEKKLQPPPPGGIKRAGPYLLGKL